MKLRQLSLRAETKTPLSDALPLEVNVTLLCHRVISVDIKQKRSFKYIMLPYSNKIYEKGVACFHWHRTHRINHSAGFALAYTFPAQFVPPRSNALINNV